MDNVVVRIGATGKLNRRMPESWEVVFAPGDPCVLVSVEVDETLGFYCYILEVEVDAPDLASAKVRVESLGMVDFDGNVDPLVGLGYRA